MLRGIDVSSWEESLNVNGIAADFVIAKATGGTGYVDADCDNFVQAAIAGGKKWGVYHFYSDGYGGNDPIAEADHFVDNCLGYIKKGIIILDWEEGGNPQVRNPSKALAWLQHVEARTGVKPIIYMSLSLIQELDWRAVINNGNGLWCAAYLENNTPIIDYGMDPNRDPNPHWDGNLNDVMWQFTSTGRLNGYGGNLDCNFFYGDQRAWDAYAGISAPAPPPPEPTTTQIPPPDPEPTTTTTTEAPLPPNPEPTTTTTSTTEVEPTPPYTTTTTTQEPNPPVSKSGFWAGIFAAIGIILAKIWYKLTGGK